jgi:hypothetical protein
MKVIVIQALTAKYIDMFKTQKFETLWTVVLRLSVLNQHILGIFLLFLVQVFLLEYVVQWA